MEDRLKIGRKHGLSKRRHSNGSISVNAAGQCLGCLRPHTCSLCHLRGGRPSGRRQQPGKQPCLGFHREHPRWPTLDIFLLNRMPRQKLISIGKGLISFSESMEKGESKWGWEKEYSGLDPFFFSLQSWLYYLFTPPTH